MSVIEVELPAERSRLCEHVLGLWENNPCLLLVKCL
jgi:hypothetical protein